MGDVSSTPLAAVNFLRFDDSGAPYLIGCRCVDCGAVAPGERVACNACGSRTAMKAARLAERGRLYSYTIVHRSFPGVKTPFIAAIVDLNGGGALKGTLIDVPANPAHIAYDMPVAVIFRDTGQTGPDGRPFHGYFFAPSAESAR